MDKKTLKNDTEKINVETKDREKENDINDIESITNDESSNKDSSNDFCEIIFEADNFNFNLVVLNEVSRIAHMGMNSISYLVNRIYDKELKKTLVAIYSQYSNILLQVNQYFEKYGEVPSNVSVHDKMMCLYGIRLHLKKDKSTSKIAEMMIQGSLMGVIEVQRILNADLDIDKDITDLLKRFNKFQRENIDKLNAYL